MEVEGKYTLPNGEVIEVHVNLGINTWRNGEWVSFQEMSQEEFFFCLVEMNKLGEVKFEPKDATAE